jgi:hypothetical protein
MYGYFSRFYNKPLGWNLFSSDTEDGTPSPPESQVMITQDSINMDTEDGQLMITE